MATSPVALCLLAALKVGVGAYCGYYGEKKAHRHAGNSPPPSFLLPLLLSSPFSSLPPFPLLSPPPLPPSSNLPVSCRSELRARMFRQKSVLPQRLSKR